MQRDLDRLRDIVDAAAAVRQYLAGREDTFFNDPILRDAVLRQLMIVGEAASRLSEDFRAAHPESDWTGIIGFRNRIVHDYLGLDLEVAMDICRRHLPALVAWIDATFPL